MARALCALASILWLMGVTGCETAPAPKEEDIWADVKITDLAPPPADRLPPPQFLATVRLDVHLVDLPAANVELLDEAWQLLSAGPIQMSSYNAFTDNGFRVKFGKVQMWPRIQELLAAADGQQAGTTSLTVTDNDTTDLPVADLPVARRITFVGTDLSRQAVNVGAGLVALRLRAEPIPWARGVRKIIAYPVYTLPLTTNLAPLQARARQQEFYFAAAAFALQMGPGDLVVLGPDQYTGERLSLGGLFFSNPAGTRFFNPAMRKPPEHKPAARLYVLVCSAISD